MIRALVCLFVLGLLTTAASSEEAGKEAEWTWLDRVLRKEADQLAFLAAEFGEAENSIAAADLYQEAILTLSGHEKNGWRFHSYRQRYRELALRDGGGNENLPGAEFDAKSWDGFDPALLTETRIPNLEFRDKPLTECVEWLAQQFAAGNSKGHTLQIELDAPEAEDQGPGSGYSITLRLVNAPVYEGFRYTAALVSMRMRWGDRELILEPLSSNSREMVTLVFPVDPGFSDGKFGTGKELAEEIGIKLVPGESLVLSPENLLIVRVRDENLVEVAMWLKMLDRMQQPDAGVAECRDRLRMAEHYASIGETKLHDRRLRLARLIALWMERMNPQFTSAELEALQDRLSRKAYLAAP